MTNSTLLARTVADRAQSTRSLTLGLCMNIVAIAFESIAVATAMPVAARELNGIGWYAWSFSLFLIGMLFSTVVAGRLSDRVGFAKPLLTGLAVFVLGLVIAGSAVQMAQLVTGRLIQGLGSGLINTAVFVCVAVAYREADRPQMFTYLSTAWVLPAFVGPPVAAWLTQRWGWHWVFFSVIPLVVVGGLLILPSLRQLMVPPPTSAAAPGTLQPAPLWAAGLVAVAAAGLQLAGQQLGWTGAALLLGGIVALVVGLPHLMPACFGRVGRGLPAVIITRGLLSGAFVGGEAFVPLMLVEQRQLGLVLAGAALTVGSIGWMTGSWLQSRPWFSVRRDRIITLGCVSVAVGLGGIATIAFVSTLPYWLAGMSWVFSGFGMGLATSSTAVVVMTLSSEHTQGRNASSLNLSDALGAGLLVGLSGTLFTALHATGQLPLTFGTLLLTMSAVAVLAGLATLRIGAVTNDATR